MLKKIRNCSDKSSGLWSFFWYSLELESKMMNIIFKSIILISVMFWFLVFSLNVCFIPTFHHVVLLNISISFQVVLETEITNKAALKLYEKLGFVRDKRLFRYYLNGVDALRLKLWLRWFSSLRSAHDQAFVTRQCYSIHDISDFRRLAKDWVTYIPEISQSEYYIQGNENCDWLIFGISLSLTQSFIIFIISNKIKMCSFIHNVLEGFEEANRMRWLQPGGGGLRSE